MSILTAITKAKVKKAIASDNARLESYEEDSFEEAVELYKGGSKMTLALSFIGRDGIVMATDSAKTYFDDSGVFVSTEASQKLYQLGRYTGLAVSGQQAGISDWMTYRFGEQILSEKRSAEILYSDMVDIFTEYMKRRWDRYTEPAGASLVSH